MIDENKMYVVIGVLLIILAGLFLYLITLDFKIRRIEKKQRQNEQLQDKANNIDYKNQR